MASSPDTTTTNNTNNTNTTTSHADRAEEIRTQREIAQFRRELAQLGYSTEASLRARLEGYLAKLGERKAAAEQAALAAKEERERKKREEERRLLDLVRFGKATWRIPFNEETGKYGEVEVREIGKGEVAPGGEGFMGFMEKGGGEEEGEGDEGVQWKVLRVWLEESGSRCVVRERAEGGNGVAVDVREGPVLEDELEWMATHVLEGLDRRVCVPEMEWILQEFEGWRSRVLGISREAPEADRCPPLIEL